MVEMLHNEPWPWRCPILGRCNLLHVLLSETGTHPIEPIQAVHLPFLPSMGGSSAAAHWHVSDELSVRQTFLGGERRWERASPTHSLDSGRHSKPQEILWSLGGRFTTRLEEP
jgi:hypothetical protein